MLHFAGITGICGELRLPSGLGIFPKNLENPEKTKL